MPGDERLDHDNTHCKYEKYKKRDPSSCPKVDRIIYGFTMYGNEVGQELLNDHLQYKLEQYVKISKKNYISLINNSSFKSKRFSFDKMYMALVPKENELVLDFGVILIPFDGNLIAQTTIVFSSNRVSQTIIDVSDPMVLDDVNVYLVKLVDNHLANVFSPRIFTQINVK
jgi:hypothetical protein